MLRNIRNITISRVCRRNISSIVDVCPAPTYDTGCTYCKVDLPADKQVDFSKPLNGTKGRNWKHLMIFSGQKAEEWPSKIELVPGTLASEIGVLKRKVFSPYHPVMVSNISLQKPSQSEKELVLLFPENKIIEFDQHHSKTFSETFLRPVEGTNESTKEIDTQKFSVSDGQNELILICGHTQRDIRCGMIAPLLENEFEKVLADKGLLYDNETNPYGIKIGLISHVGGHAYAGNVIYLNKSGRAIWYGRVFPENVQGIISETIEKGNIIKELYRGVIE